MTRDNKHNEIDEFEQKKEKKKKRKQKKSIRNRSRRTSSLIKDKKTIFSFNFNYIQNFETINFLKPQLIFFK